MWGAGVYLLHAGKGALRASQLDRQILFNFAVCVDMCVDMCGYVWICVDLNAYFLPPLLKHVFWSTQTSSFRHDVMQMFQGQTSKWPASPDGCQ